MTPGETLDVLLLFSDAFYGTLMTPFNRTARLHIDAHLSYRGSGTIEGALFDLGIYPAAVPAPA